MGKKSKFRIKKKLETAIEKDFGTSFSEFEVKWSEVAQSCPTLCDPMDSGLHQAPPSMGFSRQEYWSGLPFPSPGNLPDPGIEPRSTALETDTLSSEPPVKSSEFSEFSLSNRTSSRVLDLQVRHTGTALGAPFQCCLLLGTGRWTVQHNQVPTVKVDKRL